MPRMTASDKITLLTEEAIWKNLSADDEPTQKQFNNKLVLRALGARTSYNLHSIFLVTHVTQNGK